MKILKKLFKLFTQKPEVLGIGILILVSFLFSWEFIFKDLIPIPADIIVGIYHPWRDHIWNGMVSGVPFKNGHISDIVSIIYPWRLLGMDLIRNGQFPLWDPYSLGGSPLLANFQSGVLYPLNILFLFFSNINAWSLYIIIQPLLASVFCYLYLRNLKITNFSSMVGSIIFAFSGTMMVWWEYGIIGHTVLWLPLILLSIDKIFEGKISKYFFIGIFSVFMSILAGYPQITFYVLLTAGFYGIFRFSGGFRFGDKKQALKYLITTFILLLLGILWSSVLLVPGIELWVNSIRQTDPTTGAFNNGIIPLQHLITFLIPDFFGNSSTLNYWGWAGYSESAGYIGLFGLILSLIGLFTRGYAKNGFINFYKILLIISILFIYNNPIAQLPHALNLPGLGKATSNRGLFLLDFSLAVLTAFGLDIFLQKFGKRKSLFFAVLTSLILGLTWVFVIFFARIIIKDETIIANLQVAKRNMILPSILMGLFIAVSFTNLFFQDKLKKIICLTIFVILVFDLFRFGWKYNSFSSRSYLFPETNVTNYLKDNLGLSRFAGLIPQSMWMPYQIQSPAGYEPMMIRRYSEFANNINEEKPRIESGSRWVSVNNFSSPLVDLMGLKYALHLPIALGGSFDKNKFDKNKYILEYQFGRSQIYRNPDSLPKAFIVHDYKVENNDYKIMEYLVNKKINMNNTVILEETPPFQPDPQSLPDNVEINEALYYLNNYSITTNSQNDGLLFISDVYYPGWKAYLDGQPAKIYRSDYTFRSVYLPAGQHVVKFEYFPDSFKWGGILSIIFFGLSFVIYRLIRTR